MEKYPLTLEEFESRFSTEEACRDYIFNIRWSDGFKCPKCSHNKAWPISKVLFQCANCDHQTSVIAGTIFQDTHKPLTMWFRAIWWVTSQKNGASALGLKRILGLGSYHTAWAWLHKLRRAMVRPGREKLSGRIEVDDAYIGGKEEGKRGRQIETKVLVVIATEENGKGIGRIRISRIPDASASSLQGFIQESIQPGSMIHTDGWEGYTGLQQKGYNHEVSVVKARKNNPSELLPRVHLVIALLKRWLMGTHHGAVCSEHLDYYLDEFTFRFNRRASRYRGKLFYRLIQQAVLVDPTPYKTIVKHVRGRKSK